jgi:hypothetical protein
MVAYLKEKCESKGKFRAQYVGPYIVTKVHLVECKFFIEPNRVGVITIVFQGSYFWSGMLHIGHQYEQPQHFRMRD